MSVYEFRPLDGAGEPFDMSTLKGQVFLVVNVASKCGLAWQYEEFEQLYREYQSRGFTILAFPCNQFGWQEPGSDEQIVEFCRVKFGVTFPVLRKTIVNGGGSEPLFEYLKNAKPGKFGFKGIKWNFEKFLIDRHGNVVERYSSARTPLELRSDIESVLDEEI